MTSDNTALMPPDMTRENPAGVARAPFSDTSDISDTKKVTRSKPQHKNHASRLVPWSLRYAAEWAWRIAIVALVAAGVLWLVVQLQMILLPLAIALLLTVLFEPLVKLLRRQLHMPQTAAAALGLVVGLGLVMAVVAGAVSSISRQLPELLEKAQSGVLELSGWLANGPIKLDQQTVNSTVDHFLGQAGEWAKAHSSTLASGAVSVTTSIVTVAAGVLIAFFCLFFFLKEGRSIWIWVVRQCPEGARDPIHETAIRGWVTLSNYVKTQIKVAAIDAVFIGLGALILGVPMALPITVLVFFCSFIPIVGALASGAIAVLVALVDQGVTAGILMLVVILLVQQIEGNVLQPWLMSGAMSLHPIAVLLVVTAAGAIGGIPGAVFGVPIAAFINTAFLYLHGHDPLPYLTTWADRPGGPPGTLSQMIDGSYRGEEDSDKPSWVDRLKGYALKQTKR